MTRVLIRLWKNGVLTLDERHTIEDGDIAAIAERHADLIGDADTLHMIEIEFLDDPDPEQRFVRFGTDPRRMVRPVALTSPD